MSQTQVAEGTTEKEKHKKGRQRTRRDNTTREATRPGRKGALARKREAQTHQASVSLGTQQIGPQAYACNALIFLKQHDTLLHLSLQSSQHN